MKPVVLAALALFLVAPAGSAQDAGPAQDRIGYANLELIFTLLPDSKTVSSQLDAYQKELESGLNTKQAYAQQKLVEAQEAKASGIVSDAKLDEYRQELERLDSEIRQSAVEADQKLMQKRQELMQPVIEKLHSTIETVAQAEGYTHVLNMVDGSGTSILLYGIEQRDLTARILTELGIEIPEEMLKS